LTVRGESLVVSVTYKEDLGSYLVSLVLLRSCIAFGLTVAAVYTLTVI